jgi:hypothetical protein
MLLGFSAANLLAQSSVTLAWNTNSDSVTRGYNVHYGTASQTYTSVASAGSVPAVTITNLTPGTTYYFAVGAYGSAGIEGPLSSEISYAVPVSRPVLPAIALTSPAGGATYVAPANVSLAAGVTTNGHTISNVQFYRGTTMLGQDASSPYSMVWSNVAAGTYSIFARITYDGTSTLDSAPVSFTVGAAGSVVLNMLINPSRQVVLSGTGQANHTFDVQATSNLKTWSSIGSGTNSSTGAFQFTDPSKATNKFRSYRLIVH